MLREVIGSVMAITVGIIILYMMLPTLETVKNQVFERLPNQDDPTNQQLFLIGNNAYLILVFIVIGSIAFVIFLYASNKDPFDVSV